MGRVTRNSNGATRAPPPGTYQENGAGRRPSLIKGNGKKGQEVRNRLSGDGGATAEDKEAATRTTTIFDFPSQVPFEYTPRPSGFGTVLEVMKNGNESVKEKVLNECNLIFECRCCNNLFRSPRDFLTHKDKHCKEKYEKVTPAGLTELLRLAHNAFKINQDLPPNNQTVTVPTETSGGDELDDLSFDVNHLVPMVSTALNPPTPGEQKPPIQKELEPRELELLTDTVGQRGNGVIQAKRQLPRGDNGQVRVIGEYKSMRPEPESALLGANGKTAVVGKSKDIQLIVDQLTAQWEVKLEECEVMESNLKCPKCQILCGSVKELRIHSRQEHQHVKREKGKKTTEGINGIPRAIKAPLSDDSQKSLTSKGMAKVTHLTKGSRSPQPEPKVTKPELSKSKSKCYVNLLSKESKTPSRVSFRRLTNNSFSATLTLSPEGSTILPMEPQGHEPPLKKLKLQGKTKGTSKEGQVPVEGNEIPDPGVEVVDYKAMAKALFPKEKRKGRRNSKVRRQLLPTPKRKKKVTSCPSPKRIACLKCTAQFGEEKEMSAHLGNCHGVQNVGTRIGIIDRHDYMKSLPNSAATGENEGRGQKVKESTPSPFNNNENEVGEERGVKLKSAPSTSTTSLGAPGSSPYVCSVDPEVTPSPSPVTTPNRTKMPELIPASRA